MWISLGSLMALAGCILVLSSKHFRAVAIKMVAWQVVHDGIRAMRVYRRMKGVLAQALLITMLGHFSSCLAAYCAFDCLGKNAALLPVLAITPLVNLSFVLPVAPLGLGVADSVAAMLYPQIGIAGGAAVTMLQRCVTALLSAMCCLAFFLPRQSRGPVSRETQEPESLQRSPETDRDEKRRIAA